MSSFKSEESVRDFRGRIDDVGPQWRTVRDPVTRGLYPDEGPRRWKRPRKQTTVEERKNRNTVQEVFRRGRGREYHFPFYKEERHEDLETWTEMVS